MWMTSLNYLQLPQNVYPPAHIFMKPRHMHECCRLAFVDLYVTQQGRAQMWRSGRRTVAIVTAVGWVPEGALHQPPCKKVPKHIWVPAGVLRSQDRLSFATKPLDWFPSASQQSFTSSLEYTSSTGMKAGAQGVMCCIQWSNICRWRRKNIINDQNDGAIALVAALLGCLWAIYVSSSNHFAFYHTKKVGILYVSFIANM